MTAAVAGETCANFDSFMPAELVDIEDIRAYTDGSWLDYLMERGTPPLSHTHTDIAATGADDQVAKWLDVANGTPILHLTETFFTPPGEPVMFSRNSFLTSRISFHLVREVERP